MSEQARTIFTATRSDEEPWRLSRLQEVYETAQQICMVAYKQPFPADAVVRMHDHKGELTVQFAYDEWELWLAMMFQLAWEGLYENDFTTCTLDDGPLAFVEPEGRA
jgi:hypothetical protein